MHDDTSESGNGRNVGELERWVSVLGGAALAVYGAERRGVGGVLLALAGAELVRRGVSGHCLLYDAVGVTTSAGSGLGVLPRRDEPSSPAAVLQARHAIKVERSVTVNRSPEECYAFWRDPANLPRFMQHVERVESLGEGRARWRLSLPGGRTVEWTAILINDLPNELIAWKSSEDSDIANAGSVHFRRAADGRGTEVRFVVEGEPPGHGAMPRTLARLIGKAPDAIVREDLRRFKQMMELGEIVEAG
ncbi:MAG TPA: SRPBCC family protein [Gemmatimonadaceae bacterium]|nr:SRPBCC family protein [Gemmatimonadaceae bacterium]